MAVYLTNKVSGVEIKLNTNFRGVDEKGRVIFRPDGSAPGTRFFGTYSQLYWDGRTRNENGSPLLSCRENWSAKHVGRGQHKPTPKPAKPVAKPTTKPTTKPEDNTTPEQVRHKKFGLICDMIKAGINPYLWGPAGTGKSELAKQVAEFLGMPFYMISKVSDVFELKGFPNAEGKLVKTSFYKAFKYGGLLLFDEMECSDEQALKAFNGAMAQRIFDFPVEGMVEAHPNFKVIGAGNTGGTGATEEYTAANVLDASTLNRFKYIYVDYDKRIEMKCAKGDEKLVDFIRTLREASKRNGVNVLLSYRNITHLVQGREIGESYESNLISSVLKEKGTDEVRMLANNVFEDQKNPWSVAFQNIVTWGVENYR